MQIGPEIQHDVASLTIDQRSNHWATPFEQFRKVVPDPLRYLLNEVPLYRKWYRVRLGWTFNDRIHSALQKDPDWEHPERIITADGTERSADLLVLATGFDVLKLISTHETVGRSGVSLREAWEDDNASAYLGTVIPDCPNYFVRYGPNLQPGRLRHQPWPSEVAAVHSASWSVIVSASRANCSGRFALRSKSRCHRSLSNPQ